MFISTLSHWNHEWKWRMYYDLVKKMFYNAVAAEMETINQILNNLVEMKKHHYIFLWKCDCLDGSFWKSVRKPILHSSENAVQGKDSYSAAYCFYIFTQPKYYSLNSTLLYHIFIL